MTRSFFCRSSCFAQGVLFFVVLSVFVLSCSYSQAQELPQPQPPLSRIISPSDKPVVILDAFLDIPYIQDEVIDEQGRYSYFAAPEKLAPSPGLNCSGFTLSASRFLLNKNIAVAAAQKDRRGDSGPGAPLGRDWDFGWDIIANISEGFSRTVLLPGYKNARVEDVDAASERGYDLHGPETWKELTERFQPGHLYLLSFNQESRLPGYKLLHYHAAFVALDDTGDAWMYQTTGEAGKTYKRNISDYNGLKEFLVNFANTGVNRKYILVLEVKLPQKG